jgi:hypothetical protein
VRDDLSAMRDAPEANALRLHCPYLHGDVELTEERERHIRERHPDLLPKYRDGIAEVLSDPDEVRRSARLLVLAMVR